MRTNYVLIDFENVQPAELDGLRKEHFRIMLFVGTSQPRIPVALAASLQAFGERAEYVQIEGSGRNALDFHIAFYIGERSAKDPEAFFHVISNDKGFDPLLKHLKRKGIFCHRSTSVLEIPLLRVQEAKALPDRVTMVTERFSQPKATRPRTTKTLANAMRSLFQKQISDEEIEAAASP